MSELALNDVERDPFSRHLDGVGVAQLMWDEAPPYSGPGGGASEPNAHL
jgi:hypothetical protein